jgi:DNA-binding HxlR family transcriptional regulator
MPYVPKRPPLDPCPVETVFAIIGGKWKARIVLQLSWQPFRFAELRRGLPGITQQVLSAQLKALQRDGIVYRHAPRTRSEAPTYQLSREGSQLVHAVERVSIWGLERLQAQGYRWRAPGESELGGKLLGHGRAPLSPAAGTGVRYP